MTRSITAVLFGTFTLRFSTGLTGTLLVLYLADLGVGPALVGVMTATYYLAELSLSPLFGLLSDRFGTHRIMQVGPIFGAAAVLVTAATTNLWLLGGTRWVEGAAAAASIPSILGFIAIASSGDELLRGRTVARFEAATLAGIGIGLVAAGPLYQAIGASAFLLNAAVYAGSLLIYRYGVRDADVESALRAQAAGTGSMPARSRGFDFERYRRILASSRVWMLAPTWIALNAVVGAWASQSVYQLVRDPQPAFRDQILMAGIEPWQVGAGAAVVILIFFAGLLYWGERFKRLRRTTIIGVGILGGLVMAATIAVINHSGGWPIAIQGGLVLVAAAGLFVLAGATPAALGLLSDISEAHPFDRGAIMGLYSVFLGVGQIVGSLVSGGAAEWLGIDGLLAASLGLLIVALLPLGWLRSSEHLLESAEIAAEARRAATVDEAASG